MAQRPRPLHSLQLAVFTAASVLGGWGCAGPGAATIQEKQVSSAAGGLRKTADTSLINEGGPVFEQPRSGGGAGLINEGGPVYALPGEVVTPVYFRGNRADLIITAERPGGVRVDAVPLARVDGEGRFTLVVPRGEKAFFASTVFPHGEMVVRMRSLVQPGPDARIVLDPLETLVAARISRSFQLGHQVNLDGLSDPTRKLIGSFRAAIPAPELARVQLVGSNLDLARELNSLAGTRPHLDYDLNAWEDQLLGLPLRANPEAPSPGEPGSEPPK